MNREFKAGDIVKHFKCDNVTDSTDKNNFVYKIIYIGEIFDTNTGDKKKSVIYEALYGEGMVFQRDYDEFMSEVDHARYPFAKQRYRFEKVG